MKPTKPLIIDKILLFGDSITEQSSNQAEGFNLAPALQHEYFSKLQIITHGYGGYNSEYGRWMIDPILDAEMAGNEPTKRGTVKLMTIFFGTNDAVESQNTLQHVPLPRYSENMKYIATRALERGVKVIMIGPAPVNELAPDAPADRDTIRAKAYSEAARGVADELHIPFVDLWHGFMTKAGWQGQTRVPGRKANAQERSGSINSVVDSNSSSSDSLRFDRLLSPDGVHFSQHGYRVWYELLMEAIRVNWPELRAENMKTTFPHIFEVDINNLPASLWTNIEETHNTENRG